MGILQEAVCTFMIISRSFLPIMNNVLHKFEEKIKIEFFLFNKFSENIAVYRIMWKMWYSRLATQKHEMAHELFMLDK